MLLATESSIEATHDYLTTRLMVEEGITENVLTLLKQLLPKSATLLQSILPNLKELEVNKHNGAFKLNDAAHRAVVKHMPDFSFVSYMDTLVMVPEGFEGKLVPYFETLLQQGREISSNGLHVVADYTLELSMFLSNADTRLSLKSMDNKYREIKEERLEREKHLGEFYNKKFITRSRYPIGKLVDRFADLEKVFALTEQLQALRGQLNFKAVADEVQKAADLLKLIKARMDSEEIDSVSGAVAKNLSNGAYEVASYVESVAMFGYYSESALAASKNIVAKLADLFKIKL